MLLTNGKKTYKLHDETEQHQIQILLKAGYTEVGAEVEKPKHKPKLKMTVEPDVIPVEEPIILEENNNGSD